MPISECQTMIMKPAYSSININAAGHYCAYDPNAQNDSCRGDSGGPLQIFTNQSEISTVLGIVSFGIHCGTALPAIYTRVANYIDWIESHVWPNSYNANVGV